MDDDDDDDIGWSPGDGADPTMAVSATAAQDYAGRRAPGPHTTSLVVAHVLPMIGAAIDFFFWMLCAQAAAHRGGENLAMLGLILAGIPAWAVQSAMLVTGIRLITRQRQPTVGQTRVVVVVVADIVLMALPLAILLLYQPHLS